MTKNQFDHLCDRARKHGWVKTPSGGRLDYCGSQGRHANYFSVVDCYGNVVRCGLKSEIKHIFVD